MPTEYLPLKKGLVLEYFYKSPRMDTIVEFRVLAVQKKGKLVKARCQRSFNAIATNPKDVEYTIIIDPVKGWVHSDKWGYMFPFTPTVGREWYNDPDLFKIESLKAKASTHAGDFKNCMLVQRLVAGGVEVYNQWDTLAV